MAVRVEAVVGVVSSIDRALKGSLLAGVVVVVFAFEVEKVDVVPLIRVGAGS